MLIKIGLGLFVLLLGFLGYVSTRPSKFHYSRSGVINAPAEKIFPYISNFKLGGLWSPYEKDPQMKKNFVGKEDEVGAVMEFDGKDGSGHLKMLSITPNQKVDVQLVMIKPMKGDNIIHYTLTKEGTGTRFTWEMEGDGGFMSKLMGVIIDCEKMIGGQFDEGIANLKKLVESTK